MQTIEESTLFYFNDFFKDKTKRFNFFKKRKGLENRG
jgi:hypothetical protein